VLTKYCFWFLHCSSWIQFTVNFSTTPRLSSRHRQYAVPQLRLAVADLSARNAEFNTTSVRVGFMVNDVALGGQVFVRVLVLPCHCHFTNIPYSHFVHLSLSPHNLKIDSAITHPFLHHHNCIR